MKQIILMCIIQLFLIDISAQNSGILQEGGYINVLASTHVKIIKDINNQGTGTINNAGLIYLGGHFTQSGTATYSGNGTLEFNGLTNQNLTSASPIIIYELKVNNGAELMLMNDVNISNELDLSNNGDIRLGLNHIQINTGGNIVNYDVNNYIITDNTGTLKQDVGASNIIFPVGNATYNPATMINNGTLDQFSVRVEDLVRTSYPSGSIETEHAVNKTWFIEENTIGGSLNDITLQWEAATELLFFDRTNSGIVHWNGSNWDKPTNYNAATNISGTTWNQSRTGITSFSPFAIEDNNQPLPIELLSFTGLKLDDQTLLEWVTSSEINNSHFEIQRSNDGINFINIGEVQGAGNSNIELNYRFIDENPVTGLNYYRLKQVDFDGQYEYSNIINVQFIKSLIKGEIINIQPNPTSGHLNIEWYQDSDYQSQIIISDALGKVIKSVKINSQEGNNFIDIDLSKYFKGIYFIQIKNDSWNSEILRIIKTN